MISPMQDDLTTAIANDLGIQDLSAGEQKALIAQFGEVALEADGIVAADPPALLPVSVAQGSRRRSPPRPVSR